MYDEEDSTRRTILRDELESRSSSIVKPTLIGVVVAALLFLLAVVGGRKEILSGFTLSSTKTVQFSTTGTDVSVAVSSPGYGVAVVIEDLPWDTLAEPYKEQLITASTFTSSDGTETTIDSSYDVSWTIFGTSYSGQEVTFQVDVTPQVYYDNTIVISLDGVEVASKQFSMAVKYIRREIRSLSDDDRNLFLNTLQMLYTVSQEDGESLYGDKYVSAASLLYKHLNGAGTTDCDHWHDGAGVVVHHMAFTLYAEQSLQSINKSIAMPYWEYAQDAYLYENWFESEIFQDDWFGQASPMTDDHSISEGLWTGIEAASGSAYTDWSIESSGTLNPFVNARGDMRSPWNNNPSKLIGRHNETYDWSTTTMPDCQLMQACYSSNSLAAINDCLNGVTHGPVHILIGGCWGQGDLFDDHDVSFLQGINKVLFFKNLWRTGYTRCPTLCGDDDTDCACSVPDEYLEQYTPLEILAAAGLQENLEDSFHQDYDDDADIYLKVLRAIEDPAVVGEMFTSGAPYDPSFWPVHGQIERILALKRVGISQGTITNFDESWGFEAVNTRYLQGICDWSAVSDVTDLTLPTCNMSVSAICTGHNEYDELDFSNFLGQDETYTNADFYTFLHPWNDDIPYTYDTFRFDYCDDTDYPFTDSAKKPTKAPKDTTAGGPAAAKTTSSPAAKQSKQSKALKQSSSAAAPASKFSKKIPSTSGM